VRVINGQQYDRVETILLRVMDDFGRVGYSPILTLQPGEITVYRERWPGLTNEQRPVGPGVYVIRGWVPCDRPVPVSPVRVKVSG